MKNTHKGFILPFLLVIIAVLVIGGGVYVYNKNKSSSQSSSSTSATTADTTTLATTSQTTSGQPSSGTNISVPGMAQYTDADFGFSFWYPTTWSTEEGQPQRNKYLDGTVVKQFDIKSGVLAAAPVMFTIQEVSSPHLSITDIGTPNFSKKYFFDTKTHTWMMTIRGAESGVPDTTTTADVSTNTMGGLHIFNGAARFAGNTIIPLSADHFLVISSNNPGNIDQNLLAKTVVALDPSVATPVSSTQQIQTIQAEASAYGVSSQSDITLKTYTNTQYGYQIQYPSTLTTQNPEGGDNPSLALTYPHTSFIGTNLENVTLTVETRQSDENSCYTVDRAGNQLAIGLEKGKPGIVMLNGVTFHAGYTQDSATGHNGTDSYLNTYHNGLCYSIHVTAVSFKQCFADAPNGPSCNVLNYNPDTQVFPIFNQIASTFKFIN